MKNEAVMFVTIFTLGMMTLVVSFTSNRNIKASVSPARETIVLPTMDIVVSSIE